jgi:hypothetical protein
MKNRLFGCLLLIAMAVILPVTASAQLNQTGTLAGTALDAQALPLPGVSVTIKSPAIILPQMATVTNEQGLYRFLSLPPGVYEITFSLDGMNTLVRKDVRIGVGQTTTIDAVLEQKTLSESIVVVGQAPTIDQKSTTGSTNLDQIFLASVPAARNLDSFFNMAPGVVAEQNNTNGLMSSANGSGVRDNTFNLDGVNMTAPDVGTQQVEFGVDIIEEISIQSGGLPAEYGDASGASVNVVTRSGGNRLSGSASVYYNSEHLQANNTAGTALEGATSGYRYIFEPSVTLGGPIVKDKLWFFGSLSYNTRSANVAGFPYDQETQVPAKQTRPFPFFKLTFQPSQADRFMLSYNFSDNRQDNNGASPFMTEESTIRWSQPAHIFNFQWTRMFSSKVYGDLKIGYFKSDINLRAKSDAAASVDVMTNRVSGSYGISDLYTASRFQANANVTHFVDGWAGSHELKAGAELQLTGSSRDFLPNRDPRNGMTQILTMMGGPLYGLVFADVHSKLATTNLHGYLQDSWTPSRRLTLNLGLRLTRQAGRVPAQNVDEGSQTFLGVTFDRSVTEAFTALCRTSLSPRFGLIYDLTGDSKTLFKASFSRYIQANVTDYFYKANPNGFFVYAQPLLPDWTPIPGAYIFASYPTAATVGYGGEGLKAPRTDEVTFAVERELFRDWSVSARYTKKWDRNLVEDVDANQLDIDRLMTDGELVWTNWSQVAFTDPYDVVEKYFWSQDAIVGSDLYLVNAPGAKRDYDGLELSVAKRHSAGWSGMASYVWQNSRGLIGTDWNNSITGSTLYNDPNAHINAYGRFPLERRHQVKVQGLVNGPWGLNFSAFFRYYSGQRYSRTVANTDLDIMLNQGQAIIFAETKGSFGLPAQALLDLRLEKAFGIGATTIKLFADAFNLFNANEATEVQIRSSSPALVFQQMTRIMDPRSVRLGFKFEF